MIKINSPTLATDLAARVGCYDIGTWLVELADALFLKPEVVVPQSTSTPNLIDLPESGISLTLSYSENLPSDVIGFNRLLIADVVFTQNWLLPWPFGIQANTATPESVALLLGVNTSGLQVRDLEIGDLRQTYFLADGRAVGITWQAGLLGFSKMHLCRLGMPLDYSTQQQFQIL